MESLAARSRGESFTPVPQILDVMPSLKGIRSSAVPLALALLSSPLLAQRTPRPAAPAPPPAPPRAVGRLAGFLADSIHMTPLIGATVLVGASKRMGITDINGRFVVDSIPPGQYIVSFSHPFLDSLFLALQTPPLRIAPDSVVELGIAVPSLATLLGGECPPAMRNLGPAIFAGRVMDADSKQPVVGARVTLVWMQLSAGMDVGVRRMPRLRTATTDARGYYRICGVPSDPEDATVQAELGRVKTAEVPVSIGEGEVGLRSLLVRAPSDSLATAGRAVVSGKVADPAGGVVAEAQVSVEGAAAVAVTNSQGEFSLQGLPSGTQALVVRRIGFAPSRTIVDLAETAPARVAVRLSRATPRLEKVVVTAQSEALSRVGFEDRQKRGMGRFLGPDDLAKMQPSQVSAALRSMPGLRVVPASNGRYKVESSRDAMGGCVSFWVDGAPFQEMGAGELDETFPASQLAAIETYQPSEAPGQFTSAGQSSCTTVVIWTQASVRRRN